MRTSAVPAANLTQLAGLPAVDGQSVLLGRVGWRGSSLDATLQAITDSEDLAHFAPCIDLRRLNLTASSRRLGPKTEANVRFAFADGWSLEVLAELWEQRQAVRLSTTAFALQPCGEALPELGLDLAGSLALSADLILDGDAVVLDWQSELEDVSLQFRDLLQGPLPVIRLRGAMERGAAEGLVGESELVLADLPIRFAMAVEQGRQTLGLTTRTPLPLLRLARMLSFRGLTREQRNGVLRQVRRGQIEELWLGADCAVDEFGACLQALADAERGLQGRFRIADLSLTPLPRAPGLEIAAIAGQLLDGRVGIEIEDGPDVGLRVSAGRLDAWRGENGDPRAEGNLSFRGDATTLAAIAAEALQVEPARLFRADDGRFAADVTLAWPPPADAEREWVSVDARMEDLRGLAVELIPVGHAELTANARVSGAAEAPAIDFSIGALRALGRGWRVDAGGQGRFEAEALDYKVEASLELQPELLAHLAPDFTAVAWTGEPVRLQANGQGAGDGKAQVALRLDGQRACFTVPGETPVMIKDCGESLTAKAELAADTAADRYVVSALSATLNGQPIIADGRFDYGAEGLVGEAASGPIDGSFLASRLTDGRIVATGGAIKLSARLGPQEWQAGVDLLDLKVTEPLASLWRGRVGVGPDRADADILVFPELEILPELQLSATVSQFGPAPAVTGLVRAPELIVPTVAAGEGAATPETEAVNSGDGDPAPILLPTLDRFITQAPDTYLPGGGTIDVKVDRVILGLGGAAAGHVEGRFDWNGERQRVTLDWLRGDSVAAGLFAEIRQAAAGASAWSQLRFATSDVETALISRLLVGRAIAQSGSVGMRLDLQGPWQRSLRRWSGFVDLRGQEIDLTEAQLLAQTILASGEAGPGSIPPVLELRKGYVRGSLNQGRVVFDPVNLDTHLATVFGKLDISLEENTLDGLAVVVPLNDVGRFFQLLPGLHNVSAALEALRTPIRIGGTVDEPLFEPVRPGSGEPEVVRTLQDTLRKLESLGGN